MKYTYGKNEILEPVDRDAYIYRLTSSYDKLGTVVKERRFHKSLIVYDSGVRQSQLLQKIEKSYQDAGIQYLLFPEINEEPCFRTINDGYNHCLMTNCDSVLAIGGKAAVDTGKGINILRFNGGNIEKYTDPMTRRNTGSGLFCLCRFEGDDNTRLLTLNVWNNDRKQLYCVDCYCNYDIKAD